MFTDRHFPPTFLSKNPSLRDMVKDTSDYDRRLTEISTNFEKEIKHGGISKHKLPQSTEIKNTNRSTASTIDSEKLHQQRISSTSQTATTNARLPLYPPDKRMGEERAFRASQRRLTKADSSRQQMDKDFTINRCPTPTILFSNRSSSSNITDDSPRSEYYVKSEPSFSYGRIMSSKNLFPSTEEHRSPSYSLHRPSEFYR